MIILAAMLPPDAGRSARVGAAGLQVASGMARTAGQLVTQVWLRCGVGCAGLWLAAALIPGAGLRWIGGGYLRERWCGALAFDYFWVF